MDAVTIRETFLDFFTRHGHRRYPSASLIPNDPTLLLTNAGMVPFKPYFLGDAQPEVPRGTSFQKCARTVDIDNVGRTTRHLTFFEMLGNFSWGDYFKREAIGWAWELSTGPFGLDPQRIWATVYEQDEDAADFWERETDVPRSRIQAMGMKDNFWSMGVAGPCGPSSELHFDRGPTYGEAGGPAVNDERYLEYYNLVFMEFMQDDAGKITGRLPQQNVDTGMGLERMAVLQQQVATVYDTDVLAPVLERAQELTGVDYGHDRASDISLRIVAEHARTATFLISDGVLPSKEGRGYVLRRLLRRAIRHARLLSRAGPEGAGSGGPNRAGPEGAGSGGPNQAGPEGAGSGGTSYELPPMMPAMVDQVVDTMSRGYPELDEQRELVTRVVAVEEAEFSRTLRQGLGILEEALAEARASGTGTLPGDAAFRLHDTYGFPVDLTLEIVEEAGLGLDRATFDRLMDEQRERARASLRRGGDGVAVEVYREAAQTVGATRFVGYDATAIETHVGALLTPGGLTAEAGEGDEVEIVLPTTPFYAEAGGQVGDRGVFETPTGRIEVLDTQSPIERLIVHRARVVAGEVAPGQPLQARVDVARRTATARSHSATHILHATVRELIGSHAQQAGSLVEEGRLRFDFPHFEQVRREQLLAIEERCNERLLADPAVRDEQMPLEQARATGAIALFGEKYGDVVRVVSIGDFSKELCGGTHVASAGKVGGVVIVREESIGANLRRLEAFTGADAYRYAARERVVAEEVARLLDVSTDVAVARVEALVSRLRDAERELARTRAATLSQQAQAIADDVERSNGLAVVARRVDDVSPDELRQLAVEVRGKLRERGVVVLGTTTADGKAQLVAVLTSDLAETGLEARSILTPAAEVVGGGAGGRGELAQAGGRASAKLIEALAVAAVEARRAAHG
ncbi:MAG: alanine--tRNA ligase [Actinomycetota bacterium]|nr:alanine--tRNA ligase [Actinomycetota bacterium]